MKKGARKTTCIDNGLRAPLVTSDHQLVTSDHQLLDQPIQGETILFVGEQSGFLYGEANQEDFAADAREGWVKVYQLGVTELLTKRKLSGVEAVVMLHCISAMTYGGKIEINQRRLAQALGLAGHASLSRALKSLEKKELLSCESRSTSGNVYRINPIFAWRGKDVIRSAVLDRDAKRKVKRSLKRQEQNQTGPEPVFLCPEMAS